MLFLCKQTLGILLLDISYMKNNKNVFRILPNKNGGSLKREVVFILNLAIICQGSLRSNTIWSWKKAVQETTYENTFSAARAGELLSLHFHLVTRLDKK